MFIKLHGLLARIYDPFSRLFARKYLIIQRGSSIDRKESKGFVEIIISLPFKQNYKLSIFKLSKLSRFWKFVLLNRTWSTIFELTNGSAKESWVIFSWNASSTEFVKSALGNIRYLIFESSLSTKVDSIHFNTEQLVARFSGKTSSMFAFDTSEIYRLTKDFSHKLGESELFEQPLNIKDEALELLDVVLGIVFLLMIIFVKYSSHNYPYIDYDNESFLNISLYSYSLIAILLLILVCIKKMYRSLGHAIGGLIIFGAVIYFSTMWINYKTAKLSVDYRIWKVIENNRGIYLIENEDTKKKAEFSLESGFPNSPKVGDSVKALEANGILWGIILELKNSEGTKFFPGPYAKKR